MTLLFCDIEGSTALARKLGDEWPGVLGEHRVLLRDAVSCHDGVELGTEGDGLHAVFLRARDALAAAADAQRVLAEYRWPRGTAVRVRMGLHTGEPVLTSEGYEGLDMHRAARVMAAGHGGQVLLTRAVCEAIGHELPVGVAVRDLGPHVLRDFPRPERLFQLVVDGLPDAFPPLRAGGGRRMSVPRPATRLLGREREVAELIGVLRSDGARLVTLTGPGGVGKTRLALELAHELAPAHFVSFASVVDPALAGETLVQSLDIVDRGRASATKALVGALEDEHLLLVVDNLEHLLPAAPLLVELLSACPRLRVLVTSREHLRVRGEHVFPVAPLSVPTLGHDDDVSAVARAAASALFLERVRARDPAFELTAEMAPAIAEICLRLDGLALAIELAAARIGLLTPAELAVRLGRALDLLGPGARDAPARQQTLQATMDWSFRLLNAGERKAFTALAVFRGGCTLEGAETVALASLATLESLSAKSLLVRRSGRLEMLETVRDYAAHRLGKRTDADRVRRRHAEYMLALARRAKPGIRLGNQQAVADLDIEIDNVRDALSWSATNDDGLLLELAAVLSDYWMASHRSDEGGRWVTAALAVAEAAPPQIRAELLLERARLSTWLGSASSATGPRDARNALALFDQVGDPAGISRCLGFLSTDETFRANWQAADALADRALAYARQTGDDLLLGAALRAKSIAQPTFSQAAPIAEDAAAHLRHAGNTSTLALLLSTTAFIAITDEAYERAHQLLEEALEAATDAGDVHRVATVRGNQGLVALFQNRTLDAADAFREELTLCRDSRFSRGSLQWEGLTGLAAVAALQGDAEHAAELVGAASAWIQTPYHAAEAPVYERLIERFLEPARATIGTGAWDHAGGVGRERPLAETMAIAVTRVAHPNGLASTTS